MSNTITMAFPSKGGCLSSHYGQAEHFIFHTINAQTREFVARKELLPPPHAPGVLPAWIAKQGVDIVLAGGMGDHAKELLEKSGIQVILGVPSLTIKDIVSNWVAGTIQSGTNACNHGPDHVCKH